MMQIQSLRHTAGRQRGVALFIALIFLVILTLISVSAMRSSTMELYMATNDQAHRTGIDSTQSASDVVINTNGALAVTTSGDTSCFGFGNTPSGCTYNADLNQAAGVGKENSVRVTLDDIASCPRSMSSTANPGTNLTVDPSGGTSTGSCAFFKIESNYDATAQRGGRTNTIEGYVIKTQT